ncbi:MAG TPA: DUF445 family protein [Gemmatimonadales bacterium]|nr:DUF445 family protein [Gemmatimonadales bacterium]
MDPDLLISAVVTIGVGALSGGITNAVAIWMLFHPYEPRGIGRLKLQGAIPKNKARLAKSIGRTVGERLLTTEDLAQRLGAPAVRQTFDDAIGRIVAELVERERGPLRSALGPSVAAAIGEALPGLAGRLAERLGHYVHTPAFAGRVEDWLGRLRRDLDVRSVGEVLTAERRAALARRVEGWVTQLAEGPELERAIRGFVDAQLERLARSERPLLEQFPPGLVGALEHAIDDYLPIAIDRIGGLLRDPASRARIELALRDAFDHSVRDLLLHERILAKLMVTDRTIERLVDGFEHEGFDRFAEAITAPAMREKLTRAVHDGVLAFLRVPVGERLRRLGEARRAALAATASEWLVRVIREPGTRRVIAATLDRALEAAEQRTWGEVIGVLPPARVAELLADLVADERGRRWIEESVRALADHLLDRPLGRPADWLGPETTARFRAEVASASWEWVRRQIPLVVQHLKVQEMVEQRVLGFSTQRMEEIVRTVTQRELDLIVRLGYLLGAIVGAMAFGVNVLLGGG